MLGPTPGPYKRFRTFAFRINDVDSRAVVIRHARWYLLCHSHCVDAVRTYRIDRVQSVVEHGERFQLSDDLDPVRQLEQHLAAGWEFRTRVVFDGPFDEVAGYITPPVGHLEPLEGQPRCALTGSTSNPTMYAAERLAAIPLTILKLIESQPTVQPRGRPTWVPQRWA